MRWALAWTLYGVGHLIWLVFDHEIRLDGILLWGGMHWPIYEAYHHLMCWSADVQGPGDFGPWSRELAP